MYIAFKWLICLALAMWVFLCSVDSFKRNERISEIIKQSYTAPFYKTKSNVTLQSKCINTKTKLKIPKESPVCRMYLYYLMFLTGAFMISILNRKYDIVLYTKRKIKNIKLMKLNKYHGKSVIFKNAAIYISVATLKCIKVAKFMKAAISKIFYSFCKSPLLIHPNIYFELVNKLRILNQERKNLGRLLIAALEETKYIKSKYQLETMAKSRLNQYVENSHKQIKENRSKYISFQQLYLIAHQENIFLKSRVRKLAKEKEDAERNLVKLVNKIWLSKNSELKKFCSQLIVETKNNLLNSDVKQEINKFVQKSNLKQSQSVLNKSYKENTLSSLVNRSEHPINISEILDDEYIISLTRNCPDHRSFSRECVWTVKDKDGIIEKLYEYDNNFSKGDSVRRIRQYSVYYDKECLLDFSNDESFMNVDRTTNFPYQNSPSFINSTSHRFLTESRAFQQFLQNYNYLDLYRPKPLAISE